MTASLLTIKADGSDGFQRALRLGAASSPVVMLSAQFALHIARKLDAGDLVVLAAMDVQARAQERGQVLIFWQAVALGLLMGEAVRLLAVVLQ